MDVNTSIKNSTINLSDGQHKITCPLCSSERRKNKHDKPLSVNIDSDKVILQKITAVSCEKRNINQSLVLSMVQRIMLKLLNTGQLMMKRFSGGMVMLKSFGVTM